MNGPADDRLVVCIDLRHELAEVMDPVSLDERFREAMRDAHVRSADVSRVLVIDTVGSLLEHHAAYERLCSNALVSTLLCLAVGPLPGPDGRVLDLPSQLRPPMAATLWVGDVRGIGWRPGQGRSLSLTDADIAADDITGLEPLIDLLKVAEVFDETVSTLGELPSAVASPALRLLVHEVPEEDLMRTELQAMNECVSLPDDLRTGSAPGGVLDVLAGYTSPDELALEDCLPENSLLRQAHWRCMERLGEANDRLNRLAGWRGLVAPAAPLAALGESVRGVGHALADYRDAIEQTFEWADGRAGLDADGRDHLTHMGIQLPHVPGTRPEEVGAELRERVSVRLQRRRPLPEIVSWLRDFAERSVPAGSAAQLDRLRLICPDTLLDTLVDPPPPSLDGRLVRAGTWSAVAALTAAASPLGIWGALLTLVLLAAGAIRTAGSPAEVPRVTVGALLGIWLTGSAAGLALHAVGIPVWAGVPLLALAFLAAALAVGALWATALSRWRVDSGLAEAAEAGERLGEVLDRGVLRHWLLADARAGASDQAKALAHLVQAVCTTLMEFAGQLGRRARPTWDGPPRNSRTGPAGGRGGRTQAVEYVGQAGLALQTTLAGDMADLVAEVLAPYWEVVLRDPSSAAGLPVVARTDELMRVFQQHLAQVGTTPTPPFASASSGRPDPATLVGVDLRRIVDVLRPDGRDDALQLCSPDQLRMLDRAPASARGFGFVPHAMQGAFWKAVADASGSGRAPGDRPRPEGTPPGDGWAADRSPDQAALPEIVWTTSGRFAGLLRLVPLSIGAVRTVWPEEADMTGSPRQAPSPPSASHAPGETG
ncbi:hypothetical protein ABZZ47_22040 [Streptomyces sp. NPDC006465]|uniref:hypothetical protein n=1 Tax=Streptomyces sp. NPDC006465 TaxID=3157174 RepID=UPI0033A73173